MIIPLFQFKGGAGKTTAVANIGYCMAMGGQKILLVDADPQAHLTAMFAVKEPFEVSVKEFFLDGTFNPVKVRENIDLVPSRIEAIEIEGRLINEIGRELFLKNSLAPLKDKYDHILIDCPPNMGMITINALVAADTLIIPVQPEFLSGWGLIKMLSIVDKVRKLNPEIDILGAFISRINGRTNLHNHILEDVKKNFPHHVFETFIRENITVAEAPAFNKTVVEFNPTSNGAKDYMKLTKEINAKIKERKK